MRGLFSCYLSETVIALRKEHPCCRLVRVKIQRLFPTTVPQGDLKVESFVFISIFMIRDGPNRFMSGFPERVFMKKGRLAKS
jgi:hypothetical protein